MARVTAGIGLVTGNLALGFGGGILLGQAFRLARRVRARQATPLEREGKMAASGAVLVGGQSRRMGIDKPLLSFRGRRMIEWVVEALSQVVDEVLLVGRGAGRLAWLGLSTVEDLVPGGGPLAGIFTALTVARSPHCLVVACDMPFLDPALLAYLLEQAPGWDAVVPAVDGHLEPLHAVYARSCLPVIGRMLAAGELCPLDLYPRVRVRYVGEGEIAAFAGGRWSFINFNTPEDLKEDLQASQTAQMFQPPVKPVLSAIPPGR